MVKLKIRDGGSFASLPVQSPILSTWVNLGQLAPDDLAGYDVDLSGLGYSAEPQAWFQPYQ